MSRFQKKCVLVSASLHGLLFLILLVGPAWLALHEPKPVQVLQLIQLDARATDGETTAAQPAPQPTPEPEPEPQPVRQPEPQPQPAPPPPQPQPRVEQPPPQPRQTVQANVPEPKPVRRRPEVDVNLNQVVTRNTSTSKPADPTPAPVQPSVNNSVVRDLRRNLSSSMEIPTPTGGGGEAYINYALLVKAEYERAWDKPARIDDDSAAVRVSVTIARNGDVLSAEILKRSGVSTLDNSVQRALALRKLPPFPPEARDAKRTFVIIFKLTSN